MTLKSPNHTHLFFVKGRGVSACYSVHGVGYKRVDRKAVCGALTRSDDVPKNDLLFVLSSIHHPYSFGAVKMLDIPIILPQHMMCGVCVVWYVWEGSAI